MSESKMHKNANTGGEGWKACFKLCLWSTIT